jgi:3-oxoacyl-[acyl-carrier protein] reductase
VALITGSTRGIGWRTAELFAEHGASVVVHGRGSQADIDARAIELQERFGGVHIGVTADVRDAEAIRIALRKVFSSFKRLDVLVNNAGILDDALIGMISDESINTTFDTNTISAIHFLQGSARLMKRTGAGSIINVSSIIGVEGNVGQIVYSSSKAALLGMTKSAAKELAAWGIRVNAIAPGFIDTEFSRFIPAELFEERVSSIAMARIGTAADVANVILFLASDLSSYVTGQVVGVDGGMVI